MGKEGFYVGDIGLICFRHVQLPTLAPMLSRSGLAFNIFIHLGNVESFYDFLIVFA